MSASDTCVSPTEFCDTVTVTDDDGNEVTDGCATVAGTYMVDNGMPCCLEKVVDLAITVRRLR